MKTLSLSLWISAVLVGCQTSPAREHPAPAASAPIARVTPSDELDRLDQRQPLPLLPMMAHHQKENMRDHLSAVEEVVAGTALGDFEKVARAAQRIGYSEPMAQMCKHMGGSTPGFTEQALAFHHAADRISAAAKQKDSVAVMTALAATLSTCTGCHATYKQKLVDSL